MLDHIFVKGARENNLKNIDVDIPGTSWWCSPACPARANLLAFDTIYAEGQRRYVGPSPPTPACSWARWRKPDVDGPSCSPRPASPSG